ncbi:S8 family serine peptidase [Pseudoxanthomonas putridarboris]|uniref:S8 family serine peptidase n=1 Tax=Pseudoxanthomonas putridarboris TaxID=752605 RepID=A0ABU9IZN0_9GAMM
MADTFIDVELVPDIALPFEPSAELQLQGFLADAWASVAVLFPGIRLDPGFSSLDPATIADLVDAARMRGFEPPDPFAWFQVPCDDLVADDLLAALRPLPFIAYAERRLSPVPAASTVGHGTNPLFRDAHFLRSPAGADAVYAWRVPGGTGRDIRVADIEHSWDTQHEELVGASVQRHSTFAFAGEDRFTAHGTAVLGVLVASNNRAGIVGVVPDAGAFLVSDTRATGVGDTADALQMAALAAGPGGVVLIELAPSFFPPSANKPDVPVEISRKVQRTIPLLTFFGITVVEPFGNSNRDLDDQPAMKHFSRLDPTFFDSTAIVVGAGLYPSGSHTKWHRAGSSSFGSRVDCFAYGEAIQTATSPGIASYTNNFGGTSGASAIVAGIACAVQGMCYAATGDILQPGDIRAMFRDPTLGTAIDADQKIGACMPNLRKIARRCGWLRVLPITGVATGPASLAVAYIDDDDLLVRREWSPSSGWSKPLPDSAYSVAPAMVANQPAVAFTHETTPLDRTLVEVVTLGQEGSLHYTWWDSRGQVGVLATERTPKGTVAEGTDVAIVRIGDEMTVAAIDVQGQLVAMTGDSGVHLNTLLSTPAVLDADYARSAGPAMSVDALGGTGVAAVDSRGTLRWVQRTPAVPPLLPAWLPPASLPGAVAFEPGVRPCVAAVDGGYLVVAVGSDGLLHSCGIGSVPPFLQPLAPVDPAVTVSMSGPISLARVQSDTLAVAAVGSDGLLRIAYLNLQAGTGWSPFEIVDSRQPVSPLGGATLVPMDGNIMVMAVFGDSQPCWSAEIPFIGGWLPLQPIRDPPDLEL